MTLTHHSINNFDLHQNQRTVCVTVNVYNSSLKCRLLEPPELVLDVAAAGVSGRLEEHLVLALRCQHEGLHERAAGVDAVQGNGEGVVKHTSPPLHDAELTIHARSWKMSSSINICPILDMRNEENK